MRSWEECLDEKVCKRSEDIEQARSLYEMAEVKDEDNQERDRTEKKVFLIVETYWEIIKGLATALLKIKGFKSYSQECLIAFVEEKYDFERREIDLMDQLRKLRNDIDYRGKFLDLDYLDRNQERITDLINKTKKLCKSEIRDYS